MTEGEITWIIAALRSGNFQISMHAQKRMDERTMIKADIVEVGHNYVDCFRQENGNYLVEGFNLDGEVTEVICAYDGEVLIVTIFTDD